MQWKGEVSEGKDPERTFQAAVTAWGEWGPWVWTEVKGASLLGCKNGAVTGKIVCSQQVPRQQGLGGRWDRADSP